ncbi:MAG: sulfurtransferase [Methanomassiliicoccales archaeon]|nr:MAG: sulfurtransferase [Methanomassiliicoccales archaeon]
MSEHPFPKGEGKVRWVSTSWLEDHIEDDILILDCQPQIHDYILEHIPGAVYAEEGHLRVSEYGRPGVYAPEDAIDAIFGRIGIEKGRPVVVATGVGQAKRWGDGLEQTHWAYCLARYGHDKIYVLDGGIDKWRSEGRRLTKEFPKKDTSQFVSEVNEDYYVDMEEVKELKDRGDVVLLDARPPPVYEGQGPWAKPGHIPGSINLPWRSIMEPGNTRKLRPIEEVRKAFTSVGATPDKLIICSCGTSREATCEFIALKWLLDYPSVHIYEGAYTEWSSYPENPTVVGKDPY